MANQPLPQRQLPVLDQGGNFVLTWYRWLQNLTTATGPEGPQGPTGPTGATGPPGSDSGLGVLTLGLMDTDGRFLPLSGGIMANGSASQPSIAVGAPTVGIYGDGTSLYVAIAGSQSAVFTAGAITASASANTVLQLLRLDATLSSGTSIGTLRGAGFNSTGANLRTWAAMNFTARVATTGSEEGEIIFQTFHGGAVTTDFVIDAGVLYGGTFASSLPLATSTGGIVGIAANSYSRQTPATGFSITVGNGVSALLLKPAAGLATGTVTMPAAPIDGHEVVVTSTQTITSMTIQANGGQTMFGGISAAAFNANTFAKWKYNLANTEWYRVG